MMPTTPSSPQATPQVLDQVAPDSTLADSAASDTSALDPQARQALERITEDAERGLDAILQGDFRGFGEIAYRILAESVAGFIPLLLKALVILALLYGAYRVVDRILDHVLERNRSVDAGLQSMLMKTWRITASVFMTVIFLDQLHFSVMTLLAGLSIAGIALGFAARDTLENFISGVTILFDRPFRVGDNIEVDGVYGTVEEITLRSTRIRTLNNTIMVLPNIHMISSPLINHTMLGLIRVEIPFGIAYKEYPEEARKVLLKLTEGDDRLHPDHPPSVVVTAMNESSVDMVMRLYLRNAKLEVPVRFEYTEKVREALREADIEIPFPHRQLFLDEAKGLRGASFMPPAGNGEH